ncbi:MAG: AmmeMemoRadiSam system protein A [Gammaproteobacteria bacterium]
MFSDSDKKQLLDLARASIQYGLEQGKPIAVTLGNYPPHLQAVGACFVTLKLEGKLRGCIGTLEPHRPLVEDVAENAYAAAFRDPRFAPLSADEYPQLQYHLSVLSPTEAMSFSGEQDLLQQIRPGIDGLVLADRGQRGTFLPSVWESLPTAQEFLRHLKQKAGLPMDYWSDTLTVERYTAESIEE